MEVTSTDTAQTQVGTPNPFSQARQSQTLFWIGCAAVWAGVSLSGNLVAAPAKFQVAALDLPLALQVGRAQFAWIGTIEWGLCVLITLGVLRHIRALPLLLLSAIALFLVQQLSLQPLLQARSDLIIAGQTPPESALHLVFAALEALKFLALSVFTGFGLFKVSKAISATALT